MRDNEVPECVPELIDGQLYGCGVCPPCRRQEEDEQAAADEWENE